MRNDLHRKSRNFEKRRTGDGAVFTKKGEEGQNFSKSVKTIRVKTKIVPTLFANFTNP